EHWRAAEFIRRQKPDLVVVLGQSPARQERLLATFDLIRSVRDDLAINAAKGPAVGLRIEYCGKGTEAPRTISSLCLPLQPFDGPLGLALKSDLIVDDLLVKTLAALRTGTLAHASQCAAEWIGKMYSPSLKQLGERVPQTCAAQLKSRRTRVRPLWK